MSHDFITSGMWCWLEIRAGDGGSSTLSIHQMLRTGFKDLHSISSCILISHSRRLWFSFYSHFSHALPHRAELVEIPNDRPQTLNLTKQEPLREQHMAPLPV